MNRVRHVNVLLALTAIGLAGCGAGNNDSGTPAETTGTQFPGTNPGGTQNPGTQFPGTTNPGTGVTGPGTGVTNPGTSTTNPGTGTTNPGTGTTNPGTGTTNPGTGTTNPGTGTTNPGTGTTNPGTGTTNPGTGTTNPGTGTTNPGTGPATPGVSSGPVPGANYDSNGILLPPDASLGLQIQTPTFTLDPGSEQFKCYHTTVPKSTETDVHRFVSQMTPGSHHFILYQESGADAEANTNTLDNIGCTGGISSQWVYASSAVDNYLPMPDGVAIPMGANQPILFDMHYINTGTTELMVHIDLNLELAQGTFQKAGALVSFNTSIDVPPNGMQTVSGSCSAPAGAQFFIASTHTHKHGVLATVDKMVNNQVTQELVHTTDWEHPDVGQWLTPPYLTFASNEQVYYACTYQNDTSSPIYVGTSAITNEMCMAILYFFPAPNNTTPCGGFAP